MNVQRTPERLQKRANRLWIWAVITQPVFSLAFQNQQPWWALNILFVFAGVTQLLALQYRHGRKGMLAGYLLLALMIWPLQPASYGLAGITLAISMATVSGRDTPGVQRLAAITAVLSLICLNGLSHLLDMPAETLLLATLPTLAFPRQWFHSAGKSVRRAVGVSCRVISFIMLTPATWGSLVWYRLLLADLV